MQTKGFQTVQAVIQGKMAGRVGNKKPMRTELLPLQDPKICLNKVCPFWSTPDQPVRCNSNCALFRFKQKEGFNCSFLELPDAAFSMMVLRRMSLGQDIPPDVWSKSGRSTSFTAKSKIDPETKK